ncbi:TPA: hypothetical protein ACIJSU_006321, partial [Pseudomonas aeruginosa]
PNKMGTRDAFSLFLSTDRSLRARGWSIAASASDQKLTFMSDLAKWRVKKSARPLETSTISPLRCSLA